MEMVTFFSLAKLEKKGRGANFSGGANFRENTVIMIMIIKESIRRSINRFESLFCGAGLLFDALDGDAAVRFRRHDRRRRSKTSARVHCGKSKRYQSHAVKSMRNKMTKKKR